MKTIIIASLDTCRRMGFADHFYGRKYRPAEWMHGDHLEAYTAGYRASYTYNQ